MPIKGGDLIHVGNQVLLDRAQTAGPGQVNINQDKIYELGNYQSVGTVFDIPDLSFPVESFDASAELESMLVGKNFATDAAGTEYDLNTCLPVDVASQFKTGKTATNPFDVAVGVSVPYLVLESLSYRFGVTDNASQTATLRGDSIFYTPGSVYVQEATGTNTANQTVALTHGAYPYKGDVVNGTRYALAVTLRSGKRLLAGVDYTEAATGTGDTRTVTVTVLEPVAASDKIRVSYASDTVATYPQASHAVASATRPAAIRGRNIRVFVGGVDLTDQWTGVQSFTADWKVTLDRDLEFGNSEVVSQDYDVATVDGSLDLKPRDPMQLYKRVAQIAGAATEKEVVGALQQAVLPLDIVLYSPETGEAAEDAAHPRRPPHGPRLLGPCAAEADRHVQLLQRRRHPQGLQGRSQGRSLTHGFSLGWENGRSPPTRLMDRGGGLRLCPSRTPIPPVSQAAHGNRNRNRWIEWERASTGASSTCTSRGRSSS
jgi:hypothetical protein